MVEVKVNKKQWDALSPADLGMVCHLEQGPLALKHTASYGKDLLAAIQELNACITSFLGQQLELHRGRTNHG
jgi:hypothetical protein